MKNFHFHPDFKWKILNFGVLAEKFPLNMYEINEQRKQNYEYI